tara:strand:- start:1880 stop:2152 length:273 start_codon:yes stop_codon:yes gene_type:complete
MEYKDESKNTVQHEGVCIPRGHRFWVEFEIDKAEEAGEIEVYIEPIPSTADKITELEAKVTPRRLREALVGNSTFITDIELQITRLRKGL